MHFPKRPMVENIYCGCGEHDIIGRLNADAYDSIRIAYLESRYDYVTKDQYCDAEVTNEDFEEGLWDYPEFIEAVEMYGATCDPACGNK